MGSTLSHIMEKVMEEQNIDPQEGILSHDEGVTLMPASISLSGLEGSLVNATKREKILNQYLDSVKRQYDCALINRMPSSPRIAQSYLCRHNIFPPKVRSSFCGPQTRRGGRLTQDLASAVSIFLLCVNQFPCFPSAASINPLNSGCGLLGRLLNSG